MLPRPIGTTDDPFASTIFEEGTNSVLNILRYLFWLTVTVSWFFQKEFGPMIKGLLTAHHTVTFSAWSGLSGTSSDDCLFLPQKIKFFLLTCPDRNICASSHHQISSNQCGSSSSLARTALQSFLSSLSSLLKACFTWTWYEKKVNIFFQDALHRTFCILEWSSLYIILTLFFGDLMHFTVIPRIIATVRCVRGPPEPC